MTDAETLRRLLDAVAAFRDELAPPEREVLEELEARAAKGQAGMVGDDRSLEILLRNVKIRREKGLTLRPKS